MKRAEKELVKLFLRNGCLRSPSDERQEQEGHRKYKKGYELRWTAMDAQETEKILDLLSKVGFKVGKPYPKRTQTILPVYGKSAVLRFQKLLAAY